MQSIKLALNHRILQFYVYFWHLSTLKSFKQLILYIPTCSHARWILWFYAFLEFFFSSFEIFTISTCFMLEFLKGDWLDPKNKNLSPLWCLWESLKTLKYLPFFPTNIIWCKNKFNGLRTLPDFTYAMVYF